MEFSQHLPHLPGILHGNRLVVVAVVDVHTRSCVIPGQLKDVTAVAGAVKVLFLDGVSRLGDFAVG